MKDLNPEGFIGEAFALIFKGAFSGTAAAGGFLGATFAIAVRQGLSRGVFSNDAGLGASAMLMAQAEDHKHAAEAGSWAIMETFIDTIVICTLTASMHSNRVAIENITNSKAWGMIAEAACIVTCIFGYFMDITDEYFFHPTDQIKAIQRQKKSK